MQQRLSFITLGVNDLNTMKTFYHEKFGWKPLRERGGIVFYLLNGFIFALYPLKELVKDASVATENPTFKGFTLAINLTSEEEVNAAFTNFRASGVSIVKEPQKVFWGGFSGYVKDPENNLWEIAYNPFLEMDATGNVTSHP